METRIEPVEEFPPVPMQLLWMFDGIDRKEATKMMHKYAAAAIAQRFSRERIPAGLIRALQVQVQVDEDGTLVGVSRQALDELFDWNDAPYSPETPNVEVTGAAASSRQVACTDGLGVAVPITGTAGRESAAMEVEPHPESKIN